MNTIQVSKLSMYMAVQKVCRQFEQHWQQIPAATPMIADLERCIDKIQDVSRRQESLVHGLALHKKEIRLQMGQQAFDLAEAVMAYGAGQRDTLLIAQVKRGLSGYLQGRETMLKGRAEEVLNIARPLEAKLTAYGVQEGQLNELQNSIRAFAELLAAPRAAITNRQEATHTLSACIDKTDDLLANQLDKVMTQIRKTPFYMNYKAARRVVSHRGRGRVKAETQPSVVEAQA